MATEIRWEEAGVWDGITELNAVPDARLRLLETPDTTQLNNDLATSGAVAATAVFVFVKLGQNAITAVRDVLVTATQCRRAKLTVTAGKNKITYEGPLSPEQNDQLFADLKAIAAELGK